MVVIVLMKNIFHVFFLVGRNQYFCGTPHDRLLIKMTPYDYYVSKSHRFVVSLCFCFVCEIEPVDMQQWFFSPPIK